MARALALIVAAIGLLTLVSAADRQRIYWQHGWFKAGPLKLAVDSGVGINFYWKEHGYLHNVVTFGTSLTSRNLFYQCSFRASKGYRFLGNTNATGSLYGYFLHGGRNGTTEYITSSVARDCAQKQKVIITWV